MFKHLLLGSTLAVLSGCSLFGDQYRNRSFDYLTYQPQALIEVPAELSEQENWQLVNRERLVVEPRQAKTTLAQSAKEFVVPKPDALVIAEADTQPLVSLASFQGRKLTTRLTLDGAGSQLLQVNADFAVAWALITDAVVQLPYKLTDLDRSLGTFFMQATNGAEEDSQGWFARLFKRQKEVAVQFQIKVDSAQNGVHISVLNDSESFADKTLTSAVLSQLQDLLNS